MKCRKQLHFVVCHMSSFCLSVYVERPSDIIKDEENKSITALHSLLLSEIKSLLCLNGNIFCKTTEIQNLYDVLNTTLKKQFNLKKLQSMCCSAS